MLQLSPVCQVCFSDINFLCDVKFYMMQNIRRVGVGGGGGGVGRGAVLPCTY